ncbi:HAD family hydrolase [Alicyclobacillus acidiphilus]|uniref:HAD family hydrolase n=1 Tax=Alicyclobacillus acidiphilus TaxID=182455 RepID=UPI000831ACD1|nr:HAD family hydrolase [Alicyclobacillus acidiphilus]
MVILWDLDGTIQDSETLAKAGTRHGFQQVLGREPTPDEFEQLIGRPVPVVYKEWFDDNLATRILDAGTRFYQEHSHQILCYSEITELLYELKLRGYKMGIVSSKRRFHVINELESKGLDVLFDVVVAQEDTLQHKPHPAPLLLAARSIGVPPEDCIYIGDQPTDIQAGKAAGMSTIGALWGDGNVKRLQSACPTKMACVPTDILDFLSQR